MPLPSQSRPFPLNRSLRILLFGEAVTIAHVARPAVLAQALMADGHDVTLACDRRALSYLSAIPHQPIHSIASEDFKARLGRGLPLYRVAELERYVAEELEIFEARRPELVIGDFRLSLSVSARLKQIPYVAISNSHWNPLSKRRYPLASHPLAAAFGFTLAGAFFSLVRPLAFALHARPLNHVRRRHGLAPLPPDVRWAYTDADLTLYADAPELARPEPRPAHHAFLGPLEWSPETPQKPTVECFQKKPIVYVSLGSSGDTRALDPILAAIGKLDVQGVVATGGSQLPTTSPPNVRVAGFVSGKQWARLASVMIGNGGLAVHQALGAGIPVLAITSNMDQMLNMEGLVRAGVAIALRTEEASAARIGAALGELLRQSSYRDACRRWQPVFRDFDVRSAVRKVLAPYLSPAQAAA